jgi:hypothetical protein
MRTKTLLLAAALSAAGIASSLAQSNVYSINVVGYVNRVCSNGLTMVSTPLIASNNSLSNTLNAFVPPGDSIQVFSYAEQRFITYLRDEFTGQWADTTHAGATNADNYPLPVGSAYFVQHQVDLNPLTITYVGEVAQGPLTVTILPGLSMIGSKVPQAGFIEDLGLIPGLGDVLERWQANNTFFPLPQGRYVDYGNDEFTGLWSQTTGGGTFGTTDPNKGPSINVAEGFLYRNLAGTVTWTRNFTVQ